MKIATWNVNSIRMRQEHVANWLKNTQCDVLLVQELKCTEEKFPYDVFEGLNYNISVYGQAAYNGVAVLSKYPIETISKGIPRFEHEEARYIEVFTNNMTVASVYVPNGGDVGSKKFKFKRLFYDQLRQYLSQRIFEEDNFIIGGDFNVALEDIDVYSPETLKDKTCFTNSERLSLNSLINLGFIDSFRLNSQEQVFSWWDYRGGSFQKNHGMRIDYTFISPALLKRHKKTYIDKEERSLDKASDHVPVVCEVT